MAGLTLHTTNSRLLETHDAKIGMCHAAPGMPMWPDAVERVRTSAADLCRVGGVVFIDCTGCMQAKEAAIESGTTALGFKAPRLLAVSAQQAEQLRRKPAELFVQWRLWSAEFDGSRDAYITGGAVRAWQRIDKNLSAGKPWHDGFALLAP